MAAAAIANDPQKVQLAQLLAQADGNFEAVAYNHVGAALIGHVLLDLLEENGFAADDYDLVGGRIDKAGPLAFSLVHAANSRGLDVDAFALLPCAWPAGKKSICSANEEDFRFMGTSDLAGKRLVLLSMAPQKGNCLLGLIPYLRNLGATVVAAAVVLQRNPQLISDLSQLEIPLFWALEASDLTDFTDSFNTDSVADSPDLVDAKGKQLNA